MPIMTTRTTRLRPLERGELSLPQAIYRELRRTIGEGLLKPGDFLAEEDLAAQLNVSRTPLREALAMLESEKLIESVRNRGKFVSRPSQAEVVQSLQVREWLEACAIELAIDAIPAEEIDRVLAFIEERRPLLVKGDIAADIDCQLTVHLLAPRYSGNRVLEEIIRDLEFRESRYYRTAEGLGPQHLNLSADEHISVLKAYRDRDPRVAIYLMRRHLQNSCKRSLGFVL
jgi:DNA-binding GntR family transcriptional regulator